LVLPPRVAPDKVILVPIYRKDEERGRVLEAAHRIAKELGARVDDREGYTPGAKFFHWERRGAPLVIELGPRDLASGNAVLKRRDTSTKELAPQAGLAARIPAALQSMQVDLYDRAKRRLKGTAVLANPCEEVEPLWRDVPAEKGGGKFVMANIKDEPACDARLKEFKATVRCIPMADECDGPGKCIIPGEPVDRRAVIAKAY